MSAVRSDHQAFHRLGTDGVLAHQARRHAVAAARRRPLLSELFMEARRRRDGGAGCRRCRRCRGGCFGYAPQAALPAAPVGSASDHTRHNSRCARPAAPGTESDRETPAATRVSRRCPGKARRGHLGLISPTVSQTMLGSLAGSYSGSRFSLRRSPIENGSALVEPVVTTRPPRPDTAAAHPPRDALRAPGAFADRGMGQPQNRRASSPARTHPPRRRAVGIGMPSLPPQHPPPPVHPPGRAVQSAHRPGGGRARTPAALACPRRKPRKDRWPARVAQHRAHLRVRQQ
jgi:hypothetical protein